MPTSPQPSAEPPPRFRPGGGDQPGEHVLDAIIAPVRAQQRAVWGQVPWGALGAVAFLGWVGAAWVVLNATVADIAPAGQRFGLGFARSWEPILTTALFWGALHALQPPGPRPAMPASRTVAVVLTAWLPSGLVSLTMGLLGLVLPTFGVEGSGHVLVVPALATGVFSAWASGLGVAKGRGASTAVGVGAALAALVVTALMGGLMLWIRANPPWGGVWNFAGAS